MMSNLSFSQSEIVFCWYGQLGTIVLTSACVLGVSLLFAGGFQHPEPMYQTIVGVLPAASYPHAQQVGMYAPPPQRVGTGVFIPPPQYSRNTLVNQNQMHGPGHLNQMQGSGHPGTDGRGPVGQWQLNSPSIVTGIPCYSGPAAPIYLQPGTVLNPGMSVPAPSNNVYWSNTSGR